LLLSGCGDPVSSDPERVCVPGLRPACDDTSTGESARFIGGAIPVDAAVDAGFATLGDSLARTTIEAVAHAQADLDFDGEARMCRAISFGIAIDAVRRD
jgi:hypothetical protein